MLNAILVPLDGSPWSAHALPTARALATLAKVPLHLIHVHVPVVTSYIEGVPIVDEELDAASRVNDGEYLETLRAQLSPELQVHVDVTDGEVASRIPLQARLNYAALYQRVRTFSGYLDAEDTYWDTLLTYENSKTLDEEGQRAVERAIGRLSDSNSGMDIMKTGMHREANALEIRPEANIESSANPMIAEGNKRICLSLL